MDVETIDRIKYLRAAGTKWDEIAHELGITRRSLTRLRNKFVEEMIDLDEPDVVEKVKGLQEVGLNFKQISAELGIPVSTLRRKRKESDRNGSIGRCLY
jgi:hypothetical protein